MDGIAHAAAGPFAAACLLLAFAGAAKIYRPRGTTPAATALGLPASPMAVRTLGVVEVSVAVAGLAVGGIAALLVAAVYLALAAAAWRLLVRAPGTACGCLGVSEAPVTVPHVIVNFAAVIAALLASAAGSPLSAVGDSVVARVAFVVLVGCCAWLVAIILDSVPALNAQAQKGDAA
jgi:hypothetical protein